jgi:hypothetical protein
MKKFQVLLILIVTGFVVGFTLFFINQVNADEGVPNTAEAQEIKDVIQHSYTVFRGALRNGGDVSEFDTIFIDTDDYELPNEESREFIEKVYGPEIAAQAGYLTAMKAKYLPMVKPHVCYRMLKN